MDKALKILGMIFISDDESAEVEQPGKEAFDFPAAAVASQRSPVLGGRTAVVRGQDHDFMPEIQRTVFDSLSRDGGS